MCVLLLTSGKHPRLARFSRRYGSSPRRNRCSLDHNPVDFLCPVPFLKLSNNLRDQHPKTIMYLCKGAVGDVSELSIPLCSVVYDL